jgi:hypothetical protein
VSERGDRCAEAILARIATLGQTLASGQVLATLVCRHIDEQHRSIKAALGAP